MHFHRISIVAYTFLVYFVSFYGNGQVRSSMVKLDQVGENLVKLINLVKTVK